MWRLRKKSHYETHHLSSKQWLHLYGTELCYKYNIRNIKDTWGQFVRGVYRKLLMKHPIGSEGSIGSLLPKVELLHLGVKMRSLYIILFFVTDLAASSRLVRMVYFLPPDRPFRNTVETVLGDDVRTAQSFLADQMEFHGYGKMTFQFEKHLDGRPLIHLYRTQNTAESYISIENGRVRIKQHEIVTELQQVFDFNESIYIIVRDVLDEDNDPWLGYGERKTSGWVTLFVEENHRLITWPTLTHELGHAFGLGHDFRSPDHIMAYGDSKQRQISKCAADYFSVNPYFNFVIPWQESTSPIVKLVSASIVEGRLPAITLQLSVAEITGLHQVLLYAGAGRRWHGLRKCVSLSGEQETIIEWEFDGVAAGAEPLPLNAVRPDTTHDFTIQAVTLNGDRTQHYFSLKLGLLRADFNRDGTIDFSDFLLFARHFGSTQERFDLNQNGQVDFADFVIFSGLFGNTIGR